MAILFSAILIICGYFIATVRIFGGLATLSFAAIQVLGLVEKPAKVLHLVT